MAAVFQKRCHSCPWAVPVLELGPSHFNGTELQNQGPVLFLEPSNLIQPQPVLISGEKMPLILPLAPYDARI